MALASLGRFSWYHKESKPTALKFTAENSLQQNIYVKNITFSYIRLLLQYNFFSLLHLESVEPEHLLQPLPGGGVGGEGGGGGGSGVGRGEGGGGGGEGRATLQHHIVNPPGLKKRRAKSMRNKRNKYVKAQKILWEQPNPSAKNGKILTYAKYGKPKKCVTDGKPGSIYAPKNGINKYMFQTRNKVLKYVSKI